MVYLILRDRIHSGEYAQGAHLPGEQRLAELHGVSRVTVRRALERLVEDGLVEKRAGSGTTVRTRGLGQEAISADMATLIPRIVEMGERTTARLVSFAYGEPPPHVASALGLAPGARVQAAVRVRLAGGRPFSHLTTHVPEDIARSYTEADLATTPLFRLFERCGVKVESAAQTVTAVLAAPDVAAALDMTPGSPLLSLTRIVRDNRGRGVEHLLALYRPDRYRLEMNLARVERDGADGWRPVAAGAQAAR